jgi:hypothetical protein
MEKHMVYKCPVFIRIVVGLTLLICGCQNSGSEEKIAPKVSKAAKERQYLCPSLGNWDYIS